MIEVVLGIIENSNGRVLLAQRPPGKKLAGLWEFPGGKIEPGESRDAALARELKEELHLEVSLEKYLGAFEYVYEWGSVRLFTYKVKALSAPRPSRDVHVFKWVDPKEIDASTLTPADVEPLHAYLASSRPKTE